MALRMNDAAAVLVAGQFVMPTAHLGVDIQVDQKQGTSHRGYRCGDQQAVIATALRAGQRTGGVPADAIGDQPFAPQGLLEFTTNITPQAGLTGAALIGTQVPYYHARL